MLSRIAENLYWIGRYVERAENTARLLNVNYLALVQAPLVTGGPEIVTEQWAPLLAISGTEAPFRTMGVRADAGTVPHWLAVHADNPGSIRGCLVAARHNALGLRDRISLEMWEALNAAYLSMCIDLEAVIEEDALSDYCMEALRFSHAFFGIADATLPRDEGWSFLQAGRFLERADNTLRTLGVRYRESRGEKPVAEGIATHRARALLKSQSALEAYRKRNQSDLHPSSIASFLLLDPTFPRSVRFSLRALRDVLRGMAHGDSQRVDEPARQAGRLTALLAYAPSASVILEDESPGIEVMLGDIAAPSDAIAQRYFGRDEGVSERGEGADPEAAMGRDEQADVR